MPALSQLDEEPWHVHHRLRYREPVLGACVLQSRCDDASPHLAAADGLCVAHDCLRQPMPLLLGAELQQVLHREISEAVARERDSFLHQSLCKPADLRSTAPLQQMLHDPATVAVPRNRRRQAIALQEFIYHELQGGRGHDADALLEDVVRMRVAHRLDCAAVKFLQRDLPCLVRSLVQGVLHPSRPGRVLRVQPGIFQHRALPMR
mmetsp:Transcript_100614/g.252240  ORF Transcript_100614/g.252240 Transcript_100614/m.252240 type:complete len:206 (-) Transcript_100614:430-1047(-)